MQSFYGSHYLLRHTPIIGVVVIYGFLYSLLWIGRWYFEGRGYDVAYSSRFGDLGLTALICLASYIIKQPTFEPTPWMESSRFHKIVGIVSVVVSVIYYFATRPAQVMDIWHAVVIVPLFLYFIATLLPVYWQYGTLTQKILGLSFILLWASLVFYDAKQNRLDQRKWISNNYPNWKV